MSLADRIARLEARLALRSAPALCAPVELCEAEGTDRHPGTRAFIRVSDGSRWAQSAGEGLDAFRSRVVAEAANGARLLPGQSAIRVLALRPRLTFTQWAARYGLETTKEIP